VEGYTGTNLGVLVGTTANKIDFVSETASLRATSIQAVSSTFTDTEMSTQELRLNLTEGGELILAANVYGTPSLLQPSAWPLC
jgi:hypothetical protein